MTAAGDAAAFVVAAGQAGPTAAAGIWYGPLAGQPARICSRIPSTNLVFAPDDRALAAAVQDETDSTIIVLDPALEPGAWRQFRLPGFAEALAWTVDGLVVLRPAEPGADPASPLTSGRPLSQAMTRWSAGLTPAGGSGESMRPGPQAASRTTWPVWEFAAVPAVRIVVSNNPTVLLRACTCSRGRGTARAGSAGIHAAAVFASGGLGRCAAPSSRAGPATGGCSPVTCTWSASTRMLPYRAAPHRERRCGDQAVLASGSQAVASRPVAPRHRHGAGRRCRRQGAAVARVDRGWSRRAPRLAVAGSRSPTVGADHALNAQSLPRWCACATAVDGAATAGPGGAAAVGEVLGAPPDGTLIEDWWRSPTAGPGQAQAYAGRDAPRPLVVDIHGKGMASRDLTSADSHPACAVLHGQPAGQRRARAAPPRANLTVPAGAELSNMSRQG